MKAVIKAIGKEMVHEEEWLATDKNKLDGKNMTYWSQWQAWQQGWSWDR